MEQGEKNPAPMRVHVIDTKFCSAHTMNLIVKREKGFFKSTLFNVLNAHGNQLLKIVKGDSFLNKDWLILDATDSPIATLRNKTFSWHDVWRVYKGKNTKEEESLLKVKRQDQLTLNVFIGSTQEEKAKKNKKGDFDVVGFPPTFYMNDTMIADVNNNFSWGGDLGRKGFKVRVNGGIDYVFVVALIIIHREMAMTSNRSSGNTDVVLGGGVDIIAGFGDGGGSGGGDGGGDGGGGG